MSVNKFNTLLLLFLKCLWLITEALYGSTTTLFLFQMHEYYSKSPIFPFYLKTGKKGRWIHMQMAKIKKSTQGRGMHAPICMLNCFSKLHHHLNITLKAPLEHHLCALHCKKWWFWNQRQWITKCRLSGK
jgi:hypothetical protein